MSLFSTFEKMKEHSDLMDQMMDRLGVNEEIHARAQGNGMLQRAAERCMTCENTSACRQWLQAIESLGAEEAPDYCKNHNLFERTRREMAKQET